MKFLFLFLFAFKSYSITELSTKENLRSEITKRVENIVKAYDKDARVDLSLKTLNIKVKVKNENPFLLSLKNEKSNSKMRIKQIDVSIFSTITKKDEISKIEIKIKDKLSDYSKNININTERLSYKELSGNKKADIKLSEKIFLGLFTFFGLAFLFFSLRRKSINQSSELIPVIEKNLTNLAQSIENSFSQKKEETTPFNIEVNTGADNFLIGVSIESLEEVIMDCYWCEQDNYAAYIWKSLDNLRKTKLIEKNSRIISYVSHLQSITEKNLNFINHAYYLSPLPLNSIDNEGLTRLVRKYNSIFHQIPEIRINSLLISLSEKKSLLLKKYSKEDSDTEFKNINWQEYEVTYNKNFKPNHTFEFQSIEEEQDFFDENNYDYSLVNTFPSLVWTSMLPEKEIIDILERFTAKELAIAWIAPKNTIEILESYLPEQKVELMKSYSEKLNANRNNIIFNEIISLTSKRLNSEKIEIAA